MIEMHGDKLVLKWSRMPVGATIGIRFGARLPGKYLGGDTFVFHVNSFRLLHKTIKLVPQSHSNYHFITWFQTRLSMFITNRLTRPSIVFCFISKPKCLKCTRTNAEKSLPSTIYAFLIFKSCQYWMTTVNRDRHTNGKNNQVELVKCEAQIYNEV